MTEKWFDIGKQFQYQNFYIDRILRIGYWKGHYKHATVWSCKGGNGWYSKLIKD